MPRLGTSLWDSIVNATTGTLTQAQKDALIAEERNGLIQAGADPVSAQQQAEADITASLLANHADPSQESIANALVGPYNAATTGNPLTAPSSGSSLLLIALVVGAAYVIGKSL